MPARTIKEKLLNHLTNCPIIGGSVSLNRDKVKCVNCLVRNQFDQKEDIFVKRFIKHCTESEGHKSRCGWTLKKNYRSPSGFETIRITNVQTEVMTNFFGSSRENSVHSEEDPVVSQQSDELLHAMDHTETLCVDSTVSNTPPAQNDDLATQTDATQVSKGTCITSTVKSQYDPKVVLDCDAGTQTHFLSTTNTDRGTCCSGKDMEELLAPSFEEDLKAFFSFDAV